MYNKLNAKDEHLLKALEEIEDNYLQEAMDYSLADTELHNQKKAFSVVKFNRKYLAVASVALMVGIIGVSAMSANLNNSKDMSAKIEQPCASASDDKGNLSFESGKESSIVAGKEDDSESGKEIVKELDDSEKNDENLAKTESESEKDSNGEKLDSKEESYKSKLDSEEKTNEKKSDKDDKKSTQHKSKKDKSDSKNEKNKNSDNKSDQKNGKSSKGSGEKKPSVINPGEQIASKEDDNKCDHSCNVNGATNNATSLGEDNFKVQFKWASVGISLSSDDSGNVTFNFSNFNLLKVFPEGGYTLERKEDKGYKIVGSGTLKTTGNQNVSGICNGSSKVKMSSHGNLSSGKYRISQKVYYLNLFGKKKYKTLSLKFTVN